jgi:hypothetical protein
MKKMERNDEPPVLDIFFGFHLTLVLLHYRGY